MSIVVTLRLRPAALPFFLGLCLVGEASAQTPIPCGDYREIVRQLAEKHGERAAGRGLSASGNVVELLRAEDGGWTLLMVLPNGRACLMSMGEAWQAVETAAPGGEI